MNKKIILSIILVLSLVMIFAGCQSTDATIVNGDFSLKGEYDGETLTSINGWQIKLDEKSPAAISISTAGANESLDGSRSPSFKMSASSYGVNYIYQEVKLQRGATYEIKVDIRTAGQINGSNSNSFRGAYVGFLEDNKFALEETKATSEWVTLTKYIKPATSKKLTLVVGIGAKDMTAKGTAYFDNVSLKKVDPKTLVEGTQVDIIKSVGDKYSLADAGSTAFVVVGALLTIAFVVAFIYAHRKTMNTKLLSEKKLLSPLALFIYMMLIAFIIRFVMALLMGGMDTDMKKFIDIAAAFDGNKIGDVMTAAKTTLPAGMMYLLMLTNALNKALPIGSAGLSILIRLPFILADLVAVYMLYSMVSKRQNEHTAIMVAGLYAILPSVLMASTGWGMAVSLAGCLLIGMVYCLLNKNFIGVSALLTASLLFSNLTVLIVPIVLAVLVYMFVKYRDLRVKIGISSLVCFVVYYCLNIPFVLNELGKGQVFYMFTLMFNDLTANAVLTSNAFNLYGIFGLNMAKLSTPMNVLNYIFVVMMMIATVLIYLRDRDRLNVVLMSAFTLIATSTLCARGSIELMALGVVLLFVYAAIANSRRGYALVCGFSAVSFVNMSLLMSNSGFISKQLNAKLVDFFAYDGGFIFMSLVAVGLTIYLGYVVYDVCFRNRSVEIAPLMTSLKDDFRERWSNFKNRKNNKQEKVED